MSIQDRQKSLLVCKLTALELQERRTTVIRGLKEQVRETKELENGLVFRFDYSDAILDMLADFIKHERQCCEFFTFDVRVEAGSNAVRLELTGPSGVKEFIRVELGM